jgi:transcription initiation factor TFIID subunit 1
LLTTQKVTHARPAIKLVRQFYPTTYTRNMKRRLHRPLLSIMAEEKFWSVVSCSSWLRSTGGVSEHRKQMGHRSRTTPFNKVEDYSAREDDMILAEYVEEHPPLVSRPAMCTLIRNFYQKKAMDVCCLSLAWHREDNAPFVRDCTARFT